MDDATRTRLSAVVAMMKDFIALSTDPYMRNLTNFPELKNESRQRIEEVINGMVVGDPNVAEANRAVFSSILSQSSQSLAVSSPALLALSSLSLPALSSLSSLVVLSLSVVSSLSDEISIRLLTRLF